MIPAWMLYSAGVAALLATGAVAGERFCRLVGAPVRWVWVAAMIATLALSVSGLLRVTGNGSVGAGEAAAVHHEASDASGPPGWLGDLLLRRARDLDVTGERLMAPLYSAMPRDPRLGAVAAAAWAFTSLFLLLVFCGTLVRLSRARRLWREHEVAETRVLVSSKAGPALVGLFRPRIVVPEWLLAESADRQRLVVRHEEEHRRARDPLVLACACAAVCAMPWNPALWWMLLRTRLAVELDCDARLLRGGVVPVTYGSLLLDIAARAPTSPLGSPALTASATHLERRIVAMTDRNRRPRRFATVLSATTALLLLAGACTTDLPTAAAIDAMDAGEALSRAEQVGLLQSQDVGGAPLFVVDGTVVPGETARSLMADRIRSIEVMKGPAAREAFGEAGSAGVVKITTGPAPEAAPPGVSPDASLTAERRQQVDQAQVRGGVRLRGIPSGTDADSPLMLLDGVIASGATLQALDPAAIERIEIVKGELARRQYDDPRAANGVILITTRPGH